MRRRSSLIVLITFLASAGCRSAPRVEPPRLFPAADLWSAPLPDAIQGPLVHDQRRLFVATRDGGVRAFDRDTARLVWGSQGRAGVLTRVEGGLVVRGAEGHTWLLEAGTGTPRWSAETGVGGTIPAVFAGDRLFVAGDGLAALDAKTGAIAWRAEGASVHTAIPAAVDGLLLTGEKGGFLRARDVATGAVRWTFAMKSDPAAPPVVDDRGRVLVGTTDGRFVALSLENGKLDWRWKVGAHVRLPAAPAGRLVLFASHEAVLYGLVRSGGNMAWRASLPSRPLSGPIPVRGAVLVACEEDELVTFDPATGKALGGLRTPNVLAGPPLVVDDRLYVGLRGDPHRVIALHLGAAPPESSPSPEAAPSDSPSPSPAP